MPDDGNAFEDFYRTVEPRIRRALVAACGPGVGIEAAAAAMQYGFERWDMVRTLDNPAGYLYRVGRNAARSRRKPLPAVENDVAERYGFEPGLPAARQPADRTPTPSGPDGPRRRLHARRSRGHAGRVGLHPSQPSDTGPRAAPQAPGSEPMIDLDDQLAAYASYLDDAEQSVTVLHPRAPVGRLAPPPTIRCRSGGGRSRDGGNGGRRHREKRRRRGMSIGSTDGGWTVVPDPDGVFLPPTRRIGERLGRHDSRQLRHRETCDGVRRGRVGDQRSLVVRRGVAFA